MKIIVVGAGASGLMAAYELIRKGAEVVMIETLDRIGGRIHTLKPPGFVHTIEAGAEFIHGNLSLTMRLMKKAGLSYEEAGGKMYRAVNGKIERRLGQGRQWNDFYEKLDRVRRDLTLENFLAKHFNDAKHATLHKEVYAMAQGLDLADPAQISAISIKKEWLSDHPQFRPLTGYMRLIEFLYDQCTSGDFALHLNETVRDVDWQSKVKVTTDRSEYLADAVVFTIPVAHYRESKIQFIPQIPQTELFDSIGFGEVIKLALEFDHAFWEAVRPDLGFLFSGPFTFWTQLDRHKPFLTGWIGNQYASDYKDHSDERLIQTALQNLRLCFPDSELADLYRAGAVFRYTRETHFGGGYSWRKPETKEALAILSEGIANKIWFAGEAIYTGPDPGTVEAALQSGRKIARRLAYCRF